MKSKKPFHRATPEACAGRNEAQKVTANCCNCRTFTPEIKLISWRQTEKIAIIYLYRNFRFYKGLL
jgi:hypothetical protein